MRRAVEKTQNINVRKRN